MEQNTLPADMQSEKSHEDSFYQRLKFYNWLTNRPEKSTLIKYGKTHNIPGSTVIRWNSRFDKKLFIDCVTHCLPAGTIRDQIIKIMLSSALQGNFQAAKFILSEEELSKNSDSETDTLTIDKALKLIRENQRLQ